MVASIVRTVCFGFIMLWSIGILEGAPNLTATTPADYGKNWNLTCSDALYAVGNSYLWEKDTVSIFTQAGEQATSGKYTKVESAGKFTLVIKKLSISDAGQYRCNFNFQYSNINDFTVQALASKENSNAQFNGIYGPLDLAFDKVYPACSTANIVCDGKEIAGLLESKASGDTFKIAWKSTGQKASVSSCDAVLSGGCTRHTVDGIPVIACNWYCPIICSIAIFLEIAVFIVIVIWSIKTEGAVWNCTIMEIAGLGIGIIVVLLGVIVGVISVADTSNYKSPCDVIQRNTCLGMGILSICFAVSVVTEAVIIIKRKGWCGERSTCFNTVLPVCKDTDTRGPPDGKSDNPAAKEKHRDVKLQTQKEQKQQHHRETVMNKGKPSGEKHQELSKGQPRPLPVPTGNNRNDTGSAGAVSRQDVVLDRSPMPEIRSNRHTRGLSANVNDESDKPLDDNIVHTLPVVKTKKNALDPVNAEDQSKNADDQSKKKKNKKKDRVTSRSEDGGQILTVMEKSLHFENELKASEDH